MSDFYLKVRGAETTLSRDDLRQQDMANFLAMQSEGWLGQDLQLDNLQAEAVTSAGVKAPRVNVVMRVRSGLSKVMTQMSQASEKRQPEAEGVVSAKVRWRRIARLLQCLRRFGEQTSEKVDVVVAQIRHRPTRAELLNAESRLGSTMFGPIPEGHRREFFHDQKNIWIWHEGWFDGKEERRMTIRYEIRPSGVYKKLSAGNYVQLKNEELENFRLATHVYLFLIKQKLYRRVDAEA